MILPKSADVVIIGAGVVGCSIAYHLAREGCRDVVVLEKDIIGNGTTARCTGGIRLQMTSEVDILMSQLSLEFFENFSAEMGNDPEFRQVGYLFLLGNEEQLATAAGNVALQRRLGVPVTLMGRQELASQAPFMFWDDVAGATFCSCDGYLNPYEVTQGFARQARRLGVRIFQGTEAVAIEVKGRRVQGVSTSQGKVATPLLVNAAGPYAAKVGRMAGVELPVWAQRRHVFITTPFDEIPSTMPLVVDQVQGFVCRKEGRGLMLNAYDATDTQDYDTTIDWQVLPQVANKAVHRLPSLSEVGILTGWVGLREITPDEEAILGFVPQVEGFVCANGFSGHGFMHAPATGRLIAELVLRGKTSIDISPLSLRRFGG
ncbi:MAG: FAD-binding oxidoreductase [Chloroflexi bacterium]|nr:FAD-binding oxidoreductase [Chloroflexota bacterium]